jgi:hypothetical protein
MGNDQVITDLKNGAHDLLFVWRLMLFSVCLYRFYSSSVAPSGQCFSLLAARIILDVVNTTSKLRTIRSSGGGHMTAKAATLASEVISW